MGLTLRPYQKAALEALFQAVKTRGNVLLQAATGAGKTILVSSLIKFCLERWNMRIAFIAHREQLVRQAYDKLMKVWPEGRAVTGIASAGVDRAVEMNLPVVIGSVGTVASRVESMASPLHMLIVDEAHHINPAAPKSQYMALIEALRERYPRLRVVGVTATPFRLNHGYIYGDRCRKNKPNLFERLDYSIGIDELTEAGFLAPARFFAKKAPKALDSVSLGADGDFNVNALAGVMSDAVIVGQAVEAVKRYAPGRKRILVFGVTTEHADILAGAFRNEGFKAKAVHTKIDAAERQSALADFEAGKLQVLTSVGVLTEGFDCPPTDCIVLCRPTMSPALYVQMVGRGLRTAEGKTDCIVLDLAGNYERHGEPGSPRVVWRGHEERAVTGLKCPSCGFINPRTAETCESCGEPLPRPEAAEPVPCPWCGSGNPPTALKCRACGAVLYEESFKAPELEEVGRFRTQVCTVAGAPSVNTGYRSRRGSRMIRVSLLCRTDGSLFAFPVNVYWDVEGQSSEWGKTRFQRDWMLLADSPPPVTLAEAGERIGELSFTPKVLVEKNGEFYNVKRWVK